MELSDKSYEKSDSTSESVFEVHTINQIRVVAFIVPQLTQASFLQKNQMLQNVFNLISILAPKIMEE